MRNGSRYIRYSQKRLRKQKKTIRLYGENEDAGKYYRCWNCGFICNIDRDSLGDGDGLTHTDFYISSYGSHDSSSPLNAFVVLDGINEGHVLLKSMADSSTEPIYHELQTGGNGCPSCHTLNWK